MSPEVIGPSMIHRMVSGNASPQMVAVTAATPEAAIRGSAGRAYG